MTSLDTTSVSMTLFERHVKQVLRWYADPERLARESPLASHYMLGRALRSAPHPITERVRGEVLRAEIRAAAARLWYGPRPTTTAEMLAAITELRRNPDDSRYAYIVLELRCFNDFVTPYRTSDIWEQPHLLPGSKSQHYRDFDAAVKRLAAILLDHIRPSLRFEQPAIPERWVGSERVIQQMSEALRLGRSVALSGPGGVGKTSAGAVAVRQLGERPVFWYTMRPGFNDGVGSLLFALGAFLHEHQASNLWHLLVTANGVVADLGLAAGLLRQDLALLANHPPVLCFDDLEHVLSGQLSLNQAAYGQLFELIDGLRGMTPMLLISQRPLPASDLHLELQGFDVADTLRFWQSAGVGLSHEQAERIQRYSQGNPRILNLMLNLPLDSLDQLEDHTSSLLPAFQRLWHRLLPDERRVLQQLSVYQGVVPEDVLPTAVIANLVARRLVEYNQQGGVRLLPAFAAAVRDDLPADVRLSLHHEAALARLDRGEYTAAAYHFWQAGQEYQAVQVWFPQRHSEIARGEMDAARAIFDQINRQRLPPAERKALDTLRAELDKLIGDHHHGLHDLEQHDWSDVSESSGRLWMLRGEMEDALGYPDQALTSYDAGIQVTARLLGQLVALRQRRGMVYQHRRDLAASWREIYRAEFDLEILRGLLREEEGSYQPAIEAYQRAEALAHQLDDLPLQAQAKRQMAAVYGRREQLSEAEAYAAQALQIYEQLGDRVNQEKMRSNLSAIYVQSRQFAQALVVGAPAYHFFRETRDPYFAAVTGANLAEASFELGTLAEAEAYAHQVLHLEQRFAAPYAWYTLGQVALARHQTDQAIQRYRQSMELAEQNNDPYMVAYAQRAVGSAYLADGQPQAAISQIDQALARFRELEIPGEIAATEALQQQAYQA